MGLLAMVEGASNRMFGCLNHAGLSVSRLTIERVRKHLSTDALNIAKAVANDDSRPWFLIFDNINIYLRKHHGQRINDLNNMLNITNCAIIRLPSHIKKTVFDTPMEWLSRRMKRKSFNLSVMNLTRDDTQFMAKCFDAMIARMILDHCPNHELWKGRREITRAVYDMMPKVRVLAPHKTETAPLGVVDVNESSKKGCIAVLSAILERLGCTKEWMVSCLRLVAGDYLTVRNLRSAQDQRKDDVNVFERLAYMHPISQLFHFDLNAGLSLMKAHSINTINNAGSISRQKDVLQRSFDINKPSFADAKSMITHSLIARVMTCIM